MMAGPGRASLDHLIARAVGFDFNDPRASRFADWDTA